MVCAQIELWSLILDSCLHFKTIGVGVELSLTIGILVGEVLTILSFKEFPVDGDIFSLMVCHDWDTIKFKIELDKSSLEGRHGNSKNSFVRVDVSVTGGGVKNKLLLSQDTAKESA